MNALCKKLKGNLKKISRYTESPAAEGKSSTRWLADNFYIIERETRYAINELQHIKSRQQNDCLIEIDQYLYENDYEVNEQNLYEFLTAWHQPELSIYWNFALFLKVQILFVLYSSIFDKKDTERIIPKLINELRVISSKDFSKLLIKAGEVEHVLDDDPAGVYPYLTDKSKSYLRFRLEKLAKKNSVSELAYAKQLLKKASTEGRHIGEYLLKPNAKYAGVLLWLPFVLGIILGVSLCFVTSNIFAGVLSVVVLSSFFKKLTRFIVTHVVKPTPILKMDVEKYSFENSKAVLSITSFISDKKDIDTLLQSVSDICCNNANIKTEIAFGIVADLKAASTAHKAEDDMLLEYLDKKVKILSKETGAAIYAAVRQREFNKAENRYMGLERKRGAVIDFLNALNSNNFDKFKGVNLDLLSGAKFFITLDSDSIPLYDCLAKLIGAMLYPPNKAVVKGGKTVSGYGIMQPAVTTMLESYLNTPFSRLTAAGGGTDVYSSPASEFYGDLFHKSIFFGKGIIDIDAFLKTSANLPDGCILSHDILEGELSGCAGVTDAVIGDCTPQKALSYFKRQSRWVRGDAQNLVFAFDFSKFDSVSRYKIFDNVLSELMPLFSLLLLAACFFGPKSGAFFAIWLIELWADRIFELVMLLKPANLKNIGMRYFGRIDTPLIFNIKQAFFSLWMLAHNAYVNTTAVCTGLWRRLVSKKNLLSWVTASDAQKQEKTGALLYAKCFWFSIFTGILFLLSANVFLAVAAAFFVTAPIIAYELSKPSKPKNNSSAYLKDTVMGYVKQSWLYYDELVCESSNFLPPDNYQLMPLGIKAMRTSPTNIGLYMLCVLAARDLKLITTDVLYKRLYDTLLTLDKLERYRGHFFNWYDIESLGVLQHYVSTVDSGNLLACLLTLGKGLLEYQNDEPRLKEISERCLKLASEMDFSFLYNDNKKLFVIGYNHETGLPDKNFYDLYSSEMKITSFITVALGKVPREHWKKLARPMLKKDRFYGLASWSGTMFEYLMPALFLKTVEGSLDYESIQFAIYCQKKAVSDIPWGISESAYSSFDDRLNYQYKAFGVKSTAFAKESHERVVVSPYSSLLTLPFCARAAVNNLKRIERLGGRGRYGFYEALDFGRTGDLDSMQRVLCYMSHHIGMGFLACTNFLKDNIMQKRLFSIPRIRAFEYMLEQRVAYNPVVVKEDGPVRERPAALRLSFSSVTSQRPSPIFPQCDLIASGDLWLMATSVGACQLGFKQQDINVFSKDLVTSPHGLFAFFGEQSMIGMSYAPFYDNYKYKYFKSANGVSYYCKTKDLSLRLNISLSEADSFAVSVSITNLSARTIDDSFYLYMPLALAERKDFFAHKAFSSLFIRSSFDTKDNTLVYVRRPRDDTQNGLAIAAGFSDCGEFDFEVTRENVAFAFERYFANDYLKPRFTNRAGDTVDNVLAVRRRVKVEPKGKRSYLFYIAAADTKDKAVRQLDKSRHTQFEPLKENRALSAASMSQRKISSAILNAVYFTPQSSKTQISCAAANKSPVSELWKHGISGDYPILLFELTNADAYFTLSSFLLCSGKLFQKHARFDIVIVCHDQSGYLRPIRDRVISQILAAGCEAFLQGDSKRIFVLDYEKAQSELNLLKALAKIYCKDDILADFDIAPYKTGFKPIRIYRPMAYKPFDDKPAFTVPGGYFTDSGFVITRSGPAVPPWCMVLANPDFGTLLSERSLGYTYFYNSRENKLSSWGNDTVTDQVGERLLLKVDGRYYDIFSAGSTKLMRGAVQKRVNCAGVIADITVFVPQDLSIKAVGIDISYEKSKKSCELIHLFEPIMGVNDSFKNQIKTECFKNTVYFKNPMQTDFNCSAYLHCSERSFRYSISDKESFFNRYKNDLTTQNTIIVGKMQIESKRKLYILTGAAKNLSQARGEIAQFEKLGFANQLERTLKKVDNMLPKISLKNADRPLMALFNTFLSYQVLYCRIFARAAFYQCSGAFGFRDQLQDALNLAAFKPEYLEAQILNCCQHQFLEGDVLHWWHPTLSGIPDRGIRSRCSDDYMWLPYAVAMHAKITGSYDLLSKKVRFISAPILEPGENERYLTPQYSQSADVYEHCRRAIKLFTTRLGQHGLALMGSCDWNDGMSGVGKDGKGESVWMSMFGQIVLDSFTDLAKHRGDSELLSQMQRVSDELVSAVEQHAYDGKWYMRAFFDDGTPLGSDKNSECKIDLLPQSFAALSGRFNPQRVKSGIDSANRLLVDDSAMLIRLFYPPFEKFSPDPGYIKAYGAGIRENGGQYTHGAIWLAKANAVLENAGEFERLIKLINPVNHYRDSIQRHNFKNEPYVLSADVYSTPLFLGRGGWSWYTGAAGWYFSTVVENMLGLCRKGDRLYIHPVITKNADASFEMAGTLINLSIRKDTPAPLMVDGKEREYVKLDKRPKTVVARALEDV